MSEANPGTSDEHLHAPAAGTLRAARIAAKRQALLKAAADLVVERGYAGASLDAMVERAQCSKSAVYELFGNKEGLLNALTEDIADELTRALCAFDENRGEVHATLTSFGRLALKLILSDRHTAIVRATVAAAWRHPDIGVRYYEVGPLRGREALTRFIRDRTEAGDLVVDDAARAAHEFQSMLICERLIARVTGYAPAPAAHEIDAAVSAAVSSFLVLYGPRPD